MNTFEEVVAGVFTEEEIQKAIIHAVMEVDYTKAYKVLAQVIDFYLSKVENPIALEKALRDHADEIAGLWGGDDDED